MKYLFTMASPWLRRLAYSALGVAAIWGLGWSVLPMVLKSQIQTRGSAALGRTVTVGAVDFKPWSLELTLRDVAVATADGHAQQLQIKRIYVDGEMQSLLRLGPVLDAVVVEAPTLHLTRTSSGHYDVDDILKRLAAAPSTPSKPLRFALYNLVLQDGSVDFDDAPQHQEQRLRKLTLSIPFLSNLEAKRDVVVQPRLAFELNGSAFDTAARGTPFAQTREGDVNLKISQLDIQPYLPYWPASLPLKAQGAVLDADLHLGFVQAPQVALTVSGKVAVSKLKLASTAGVQMVAVERIEAVLADVRPLAQTAKLASLTLTSPQVWASRDTHGRPNWDFSPPPGAANTTKSIATHVDSTRASGQNCIKSSPPKAWSLTLAEFALHKGTLHWTDAKTHPQAAIALTDITLQAKTLHWPFGEAQAPFSGSLVLAGKGKPAQLVFDGQGSDAAGTVHATLNDFALASAAPYVADLLVPPVKGTIEAELGAHWQADGTQIMVQRLAVRDGALVGAPSSALPQFKALEVRDATIDLTARSVHVGAIALRAPTVSVQRDADGQWMFSRWRKAPATTNKATPAAKPWQLAVDDTTISDGTLNYGDASLPRRVRLGVTGLAAQMQHWTLNGTQPVPLTLSGKVKAGRTEPGSLAFKGTVMWAPVVVQGHLEGKDVPVHAITPYFAEQLNLQVLRADTSFTGNIRYAAGTAGATISVTGDGALDDFRANSMLSGKDDLQVAEELLSWKSLSVPGIQLAMAPGSATRLDVRTATLSDFFARVIVQKNGRLNLQDLVKTAAPAATTAPAAQSTAPVVHMGPINLVQGKVAFSDRFIQPNYSADLSELTGTLSQFASAAPGAPVPLADLELRGRAEGTASITITGKVNPLSKPLALDIKGQVRDLELPPLSPYAIKYAGYGITRGKLSMDVQYTVLPDGQLTAANKLVLHQLTFGDKVDGAPNSLPVKLAAALMADRNGVIDLNLPISGSLNDPQFKVGAVVFKLITNMVAKALTSPFSLLENALGGDSAALSTVGFAPGSSALDEQARVGLDKIAKALVERPALALTVTGTASLDAERDALKHERLAGLLLAEKRRRALLTGADASQVAPVDAAEYPALLKAVYRRADIVKPRNLVGLTKDISAVDMGALLMANMVVTMDAVHDLAQQRGVVVRDYLSSKNIPIERLFLGAGKTASGDEAGTPHAELSLGIN
jgi:uncharacterized protein involved in outer membrane biogenesis